MTILGIETSCDETAAAVVVDGVRVRSSIIASSSAMNKKYGGVVPEVAAREQLKCILPVINEALLESKQTLESIDAIAVTVGPGLIGSLLVGVETAKTLSFITGKPLIPVNHVIAHMYANFIHQKIMFPAISLVVSGGHTELYLMKSDNELTWLGGTVDDAAGEAFDKTARLIGFGSAGGPAIAAAAAKSNGKAAIKFPRPLMHDTTYNFSFSGLKTAVLREWTKLENHNDIDINNFAYEAQEAITDVLVAKTMRAAEEHAAKSILLSGGVSANTKLREKFSAHQSQFAIHSPPVPLCTDNAVYIASCAFFHGAHKDWRSITAIPDMSVEVSS